MAGVLMTMLDSPYRREDAGTAALFAKASNQSSSGYIAKKVFAGSELQMASSPALLLNMEDSPSHLLDDVQSHFPIVTTLNALRPQQVHCIQRCSDSSCLAATQWHVGLLSTHPSSYQAPTLPLCCLTMCSM